MKKPLSLSILSAFWLIGSLVPNFALAASSDKYWTLEEMQILNAEAMAEIKTACADTEDFMCADSYLWQKASSDPAYSALMNYRANHLTVSAVNPERQTIKLYYDLQSIPAWETSDPTMSDLYVAQFEADHYVNGFYLALERGDKPPYTTILLNKRKSIDDSDWLPFYTEVEFDTPGLSAGADADPMLRLFYRTVSNVSYAIEFSFESCLTSSDYQPGMECRAVFSPSRSFYLPFAVENEIEVETEPETEPETETKTEPETEVEPEESESSELEPEVESETAETETSETEPETETEEKLELDTEPEQSFTEPSAEADANFSASEITEKTEVERAVTTANTTADATTVSVATASPAIPTPVSATASYSASLADTNDTNEPALAANTATDASQSSNPATDVSQPSQIATDLPRLGGDCEQGSTFPWWFIVLVLACDALIMWFFWPKREKSRKIAKKS